jgi:hypothetical protein
VDDAGGESALGEGLGDVVAASALSTTAVAAG